MKRAKDTQTSGVLLVDKPRGMTSHDVVDVIRSTFRFKKVGHAGTLDPIATGLLVILVGASTKLSQALSSDDKTYEATFRLGIATDTGDADGAVLEEKACAVTEDAIRSVMERFSGEIDQIPPMFSAKRHRGTKLYELARKGIAVKREPKKITVREFSLRACRMPDVEIHLVCTKGTYVRQLAVDVGQALGCGAHMTQLCRTHSGLFSLDDALRLDVLRGMTKEELVKHFMRSGASS